MAELSFENIPSRLNYKTVGEKQKVLQEVMIWTTLVSLDIKDLRIQPMFAA